MTGGVQASPIASSVSFPKSVTTALAPFGVNVFGYGITPNFGSISPGNGLGVVTMPQIASDPTNGADFYFFLNTVRTKQFLRGVRVVDSAGTTRYYAMSAATYTDNGATQSQWIWGTGASPVWTAAGQVRAVEIYLQ